MNDLRTSCEPKTDRQPELLKILKQVGPERIRRTVYDTRGNIIAKGIAFDDDGDLKDFNHIDFKDKTVVDIGCNFGHYSLFSRKKGARYVSGIDLDSTVLKGAEYMRDMYNISNVEYLCMDFTKSSFKQKFEISLLIDFFGKNNISMGILPYLDAVERMTNEIMIVSARDYYRINKHFKGIEKKIRDMYPPEFIRDGRFYLKEFIIDYFKKGWKHSILTKGDHNNRTNKKTICFKKR